MQDKVAAPGISDTAKVEALGQLITELKLLLPLELPPLPPFEVING